MEITDTYCIEANNLAVKLGGVQILRDISFRIPSRRWTSLIGPNGSGKTTLLKTIGGLLPYNGSLTINGREVRDWKPPQLARELAFLRQKTSLTFDFSVRELVRLGRVSHKNWLHPYSADDNVLIEEALRKVDLEGFEERSVLSLSGGELQRVFLAQSLVQNADILLLDEPTTHLDVHYQFDLLNKIKSLQADDRTIVAALHDLELAGTYADSVIALQDGKVVASGDPAEVISSELLASVFRMNAEVTSTGDNDFQIDYHSPIPTATQSRTAP